jgi:phosphoribosylformylglycinamidine synthase
MSGTFENLNVPPTLVSFAVSLTTPDKLLSPEFKNAGSTVVLAGMDEAEELIAQKKVCAAYALTSGGIAEAVYKMSLGNRIGFEYDASCNVNNLDELFKTDYGKIVLELVNDCPVISCKIIGKTIDSFQIILQQEKIDLFALKEKYEKVLESVYPTKKTYTEETSPPRIGEPEKTRRTVISRPVKKHSAGRPRVFIPVFPGTNCEYDTARSLLAAGAEPEIFVVKNLTRDDCLESIFLAAKKINNAQIIVIPGGFSAGDEPEGSAKFITAFFRNAKIADAVMDMLENRDGLIAGICNGFQALVKLGLVPYGKIIEASDSRSQSVKDSPTLTFNRIGRHASALVRVRVCSTLSPWFSGSEVGDIYTVPLSCGEGRFIASEETLHALAASGQIASQYVDAEGNPSYNTFVNPPQSAWSIEAVSSPCGRVLGRMGHSERALRGLYKNVPGRYDAGIFENAVHYFE